MSNITEIVFGDTAYQVISKSKLNKNQIIKFNTVFSVANISLIDEFKTILPVDIYKEKILYDFRESIDKLNASIKCNNKIRVWCSKDDSDSYVLLTYICNYVKDIKCNLYVVYVDKDNGYSYVESYFADEFEELTEKEEKINKEELIYLSNLWEKVKKTDSDLRIMEDKKLKLVFYDYFDDIILNKLSELIKIKVVSLVADLMRDILLQDRIILYLVERLIKSNRIIVIEENENLFQCVIKKGGLV